MYEYWGREYRWCAVIITCGHQTGPGDSGVKNPEVYQAQFTGSRTWFLLLFRNGLPGSTELVKASVPSVYMTHSTVFTLLCLRPCLSCDISLNAFTPFLIQNGNHFLYFPGFCSFFIYKCE